MLERSDLQAIRSIVQDEVKSANDSLAETLRKEMKDANDSLRKEMHDANDSLADTLHKEIQAVNDTLHKEIQDVNVSVRKSLKRSNASIRKEIKDTANLLIEEIGWEHGIFDEKYHELQYDLENIKQYYISHRLENDTISMCLQMLDDLEKRVERLEEKSA